MSEMILTELESFGRETTVAVAVSVFGILAIIAWLLLSIGVGFS